MIGALQLVWHSLAVVQDELIGLGFTLIAALILYLFKARVKLIYGRANNSRNVISVPDPSVENKNNSTEIYCEKYFLQNTGKKDCKQCGVCFE